MTAEFHYRINARAGGHYPGHHKSSQAGGAFEFKGHVPLLARPDPRRLDVHVSMRDPFGGWVVRDYHQRSAVPVYVIGDLSASMGFRGRQRKLDVLADFIASASYSAYRTGDRFGFIGCDETVRTDFFQPPSHARGASAALVKTLRSFTAVGKNAEGLLGAHQFLVNQRALIFLVSDFHFPLAFLERVMQTLARHQVVPIVLWDAAEYAQLPDFGFATVRDSETGRQRSVLMRPSLRQKIEAHFLAHKRDMTKLFFDQQAQPIFLTGDFDADTLTRHFYSHG